MQSIEEIRKLIEYIDKHITQEITAINLSKRAGYSFYHFCHLLRSYVKKGLVCRCQALFYIAVCFPIFLPEQHKVFAPLCFCMQDV